MNCNRCGTELDDARDPVVYADQLCRPYARHVSAVCDHVRLCRFCAATHKTEVAHEVMESIQAANRRGRDFEAERAWLLALPAGLETDAMQDKWESDPAVRAWRRSSS